MTQINTALAVVRWSFAFYLRHLGPIVGVSLVASAQRVLYVLWADRLAGAVNLALEAVTWAARILLFVLIVRLVFRTGSGSGWRGVRAFLRDRWPSLLVQALLLAVLTVVFEIVPDQIIARLVPPTVTSAYWAILLAVKNPTIIAFTMVWYVVAARQMTRYPLPLPPVHTSRSAPLPVTG
jgi:hypothetical protein